MHGRDKSCKTPGTSLKIPNFIAAVKSDTLREFGIALSGIGLAARKESQTTVDLSSAELPSRPKRGMRVSIRRQVNGEIWARDPVCRGAIARVKIILPPASLF